MGSQWNTTGGVCEDLKKICWKIVVMMTTTDREKTYKIAVTAWSGTIVAIELIFVAKLKTEKQSFEISSRVLEIDGLIKT